MAIKVHFSSLSLSASVDQQTGNLSVFDLVEEIRTPQVPIHLQALVISLSLIKDDPHAFQGRMLIHLLTPDGHQQALGNGDMGVPADQRRMKAVFRFGGFPVAMFGAYRFVLSIVNSAGTKVAESLLDFDVVQVTQVAQGVAPADKPPLAH